MLTKLTLHIVLYNYLMFLFNANDVSTSVFVKLSAIFLSNAKDVSTSVFVEVVA